MSSIVDTIAEHLAAAGITSGYKICRGWEPDAPDKTITIIEFAGTSPDATFKADYPFFQIRVRAKSAEYPAARDKAQEVLDSLNGQVPTTGALVYVVAQQQPFPVERDTNERITFAFNCKTMRTP